MARITEEQKVLINELYCKYGVKAQVARELGISAASVSRYIIPNYVPQGQRVLNLKSIETKEFTYSAAELASIFIALADSGETVSNAMLLSEKEWEDLNEMQKGEIF